MRMLVTDTRYRVCTRARRRDSAPSIDGTRIVADTRPGQIVRTGRVEHDRGTGSGPPACAAAAYWTQGGSENSPLAYFGGYTTLAVPSVYHWITTMDGAPSSYGGVRSNLMLCTYSRPVRGSISPGLKYA